MSLYPLRLLLQLASSEALRSRCDLLKLRKLVIQKGLTDKVGFSSEPGNNSSRQYSLHAEVIRDSN